jgi:hypothetical protein
MYNGSAAGDAGWRNPALGTPAGTWQTMGQTGYYTSGGAYASVANKNLSNTLYQRTA